MKHYRQVWVDHHGEIPKGHHIHHILPQSEGGGDNIENLQLVTPEEHYDIHYERGDYGACALLSDSIDREAPTVSVRQYDLEGYFIEQWNSSTEAGAIVHTKDRSGQGSIIRCCKYNAKSYKGYQWFYTHEVGDADYVGPVKRLKFKKNGANNSTPIRVLDTKTNIEYKSKTEAAKQFLPRTKSIIQTDEFKQRFKEITIKNKEDDK